MTTLDLCGVLWHSRSDDVLMAISTCMPHLEWLDIGAAGVSLSAIKYLLPTEGPPRRGCRKLRVIGFFAIECIDVDILKDFIMGLPNLKVLVHVLMTNVLAELTEEETHNGVKCLETLELPGCPYGIENELQYNVLQKNTQIC